MTAPLRRVALRTPTTVGDFAAAGWRQPEPALLLAQHERLAELLAELGAEVVLLPQLDGMVDACFVFDPVLITGAGAVVLRSAKTVRFAEAEPLVTDLEALGVPVVGRLDGAAVADCGDLLWLDDRTLLAGRGYRTNAEAHRQLAAILAARPGVVVMADGNPRTRRALEAEGCEVHVYPASELAKGNGGPTCLTRPLLRVP